MRAAMTSRSLALPLACAAAIVAAIATLSAQQPSAPQAPSPIFRSGVDAVQVDVLVSGPDGKPVTGLRADDFELLEDGRPQVITSFGEVNIPIVPPAPVSAATRHSDVATNRLAEGRLYVIAVDEILPDLALRARHHLRTFIEQRFEPTDIGAVVNIGAAPSTAGQDFTSDRGLLLAAVNRIQGWPPMPGDIVMNQRRRAAALRALVTSLAKIDGRRKGLILITHDVGDVFGVLDYTGGVRSLAFEDLRAAMIEAMRGGVAIYPIDPCGLPTGGALGDAEGPAGGACQVDVDRVMNFRRMGASTGGAAVINSNDIEATLTRIVSDSSNHYVLGFTSTNDRRDGRYRRLEVRARRPGLTVRTRDGYIGPTTATPPTAITDVKVKLSPPVREALGNPIANGAVPMQALAVALPSSNGKDSRVILSTALDATRLGLSESDGVMRGDVEVAAAAIAATGKLAGAQHVVLNVALRRESFARASERGFRVLDVMKLRPGRYQLRVAGANTASVRGGSVVYDLDVPDFQQGPVTLSAPLIASASDGAVALTTPTGRSAAIPFSPTLQREFDGSAPLSIYMEAFDNLGGNKPRTIDVSVALRGEDGREARRLTDRRTRTAKGVEAFSMTLPLADIPSGAYTLQARATSGDATSSRSIAIRIR